MNIVLSDNGLHDNFSPITLTRALGDVRMGIFTPKERWLRIFQDAHVYFDSVSYLQEKYPTHDQVDLYLNAAVIGGEELVSCVKALDSDDILMDGDVWIAKKGKGNQIVHYKGESLVHLTHRWDLYLQNDTVLRWDFQLVSHQGVSQKLSSSNILIGDASQIFLEEGAVVEGSTINTKTGPVYIGKNAEVMEGCLIRGGLALLEDAALKMGAKIYGACTFGPHCKVGGEVSNSIFQGYSNKGHDGFVGNSLIGEWCNLGADTNTSNLKNNYGKVATYSYADKSMQQTDVQFMGLSMGDHSKCGINTMFNTATVVGVSSNVFGADFPDKYVPSFSWGGSEGFQDFIFEKALEFNNNMMARRGLSLSEAEIGILRYLHQHK